MIPRFRVESVGVRGVPLKINDDEVSLARCCRVPMMRYSVFEGLTDKRLVVSQVYTESRVEEREVRLSVESRLENEM